MPYTWETFEHDKNRVKREKDSVKQTMAEVGKSELHNLPYQRALSDWLKCSQTYVGQFVYPQVLQKQLERSDLDTVCAYELYQMKKLFVNGDTLDYSNFIAHKN